MHTKSSGRFESHDCLGVRGFFSAIERSSDGGWCCEFIDLGKNLDGGAVEASGGPLHPGGIRGIGAELGPGLQSTRTLGSMVV